MKKYTMIFLALGLAAAPLGQAAWENGKKRLAPLTDDTKAKVLAALPAKATHALKTEEIPEETTSVETVLASHQSIFKFKALRANPPGNIIYLR